MTGTSKFVALMLVVAALTSPAAALTACWTHPNAGNSGMKCPPGCPMMARHADTGDRVGAESGSGSCCQVSSGKPMPASVPQTPVTPSRVAGTSVESTIPTPLPVESQNQASSVEASPPDTSPQAVLCTFLI